MIRIKLSDREGLRSFLRFTSMGGPLDYYEELLRAGRVFTVTKMTRTHFEIDNGLYRLNKANFWRYFSEQETDEKTIKAVRKDN